MKIVKAMPFLAMGTMALGLVGATVLAPVANAEEPKGSNTQQTVQVEVGSNLSLKLGDGSDTVKGNLTGKSSAQTTGTVTGNPTHGFNVTLADADEDTALKLKSDPGANSGIPAENGVNESTGLGWSVLYKDAANGNTQKNKAMPASNSSDKLVVAKTTAPSADATTFDVSYAFKANNSIQSGTYEDTVEYTVAANQ